MTVPRSAYWLLLQPAVIYAYLCVPRFVLALVSPASEFGLSTGFLDQTLSYVALLLGVFHLLRLAGVRRSSLIVRCWLHLQFVARALEVGLDHLAGIGFSPLFFYHLEPTALRVGAERAWPLALLALLVMVAADWELRRVLSEGQAARIPRAWLDRLALAIVLLFAVRSAVVLHGQRARLPQNFADVSLLVNFRAYEAMRHRVDQVTLTTAEQHDTKTLGIDLAAASKPNRAVAPKRRWNVITIYLEGLQANFTEAGGTVFPGLTPNLDRFAGQSTVYASFYNGVTPTINAIVSSQCGILSRVENGDLDIDRGYTRNLPCLSDVLHSAGYHQLFIGGADSGFSGKRAFLTAHHYDDVWGWERWGERTEYQSRRNAWGIHDTDLVREAISHLHELDLQAPFHLTLLTVNTHEPGYVAPDCPIYQPDRRVLNAIHCTDYAIGLLLDGLREQGELDHTVVVMMGDHTMFPTADTAQELGAAAAGWFGKVFMAVRNPREQPVTSYAPAYTPDFAPIVLDALGFRHVSTFPVGRLPLADGKPRKLIARQFEVIDDRMIPAHPTLGERCSDEGAAPLAEAPAVPPADGALGDCERERIMDALDSALMSASPQSPLVE